MINSIYKRYKTGLFAGLSCVMMLLLASCDKSQSYSELLRDEEHAVNWFLAEQNVLLDLPEDPKDMVTWQESGEDAPFYRLDAEGNVYMQVVTANYDELIEPGEVVYFRYSRQNILYMSQDIETVPEGNSDYLAYGPASFIYKNTTLQSSYFWGTGIQMPLKFMGYNSEVNLVLKSYNGFYEDQTACVPYLINIRYFKAEY